MRVSPAIRFLLTAGLLVAAAFPAFGITQLDVEGIEGPLLDNVKTFVGLPMDDDPLVVRRHAEGAADKARSALEALGYYDSTIQVSTHQDGTQSVLKLVIEAGKPVRLDAVDIRLEGEAAADPAFTNLLNRLPLQAGDVLNHGTYTTAKTAIENLALARGYLDGAFTTNEIVVHPDAFTAEIRLIYASGKRYRLGTVHFPVVPLSSNLLNRFVPFQAGDPYSSDEVSKLHLNLLNSGYFDTVQIKPQSDKTKAGGEVPIQAELAMSKRNRVTLGIGATTDEGPRLRLGWTRPWINRWGHFATFNGTVSVVKQEVAGQYTIPLNPPLTHQLQYIVGWEKEQVEDIDRETLSTGIQQWRIFESKWERNLFLRWEYEHFIQSGTAEDTSLTLPGITLSRKRRSSEMNPTHGDQLYGLLEGAHPDFFSDIELARTLLQAKRLTSWGPHRLTGRIEYGALSTDDFNRTPPSLRFYAGGDQSVRGFAYQSLSPTNETGELIGGSYLLTGSLEYQYQFAKSWRAAVFFDAGNAFASSDLSGGFAQGTGVGIHWVTALAPIKLDFAWGISESPAPFRVHLTMGFEI
jgi:translocation and assembly module TamA